MSIIALGGAAPVPPAGPVGALCAVEGHAHHGVLAPRPRRLLLRQPRLRHQGPRHRRDRQEARCAMLINPKLSKSKAKLSDVLLCKFPKELFAYKCTGAFKSYICCKRI